MYGIEITVTTVTTVTKTTLGLGMTGLNVVTVHKNNCHLTVTTVTKIKDPRSRVALGLARIKIYYLPI